MNINAINSNRLQNVKYSRKVNQLEKQSLINSNNVSFKAKAIPDSQIGAIVDKSKAVIIESQKIKNEAQEKYQRALSILNKWKESGRPSEIIQEGKIIYAQYTSLGENLIKYSEFSNEEFEFCVEYKDDLPIEISILKEGLKKDIYRFSDKGVLITFTQGEDGGIDDKTCSETADKYYRFTPSGQLLNYRENEEKIFSRFTNCLLGYTSDCEMLFRANRNNNVHLSNCKLNHKQYFVNNKQINDFKEAYFDKNGEVIKNPQ